jgi:hypothetical protein
MAILPEWKGEVAFIIAGGPSVKTQNLELLRGRRVIAINSSYEAVPWADVLFFGDGRWWNGDRKIGFKGNHDNVRKVFCGRIITCSRVARFIDRVEVLHKAEPNGLCLERTALSMRQTSLSGAINLAVHFGVSGIVLLGADGTYGPNKETHHHADHPWPHRKGCWDLQRKELETLVEPLNQLGIKVINASPGSAWPMWPVMNLSEAIAEMDGNGLSDYPLRSDLHDDGRASLAGTG